MGMKFHVNFVNLTFFFLCYVYDWMQEVTESEEARSIRESADKLTKPVETAPPRLAEPKREEPVPA